MRKNHKLIGSLLALIGASLVLFTFTGVAKSHADYERSEPAANAVLETAPVRVQIWFTQELFRRVGENKIEVYGADGTRVDLDDVVIDDDDRTLATVSLSPTLPTGVYTVRWQSLSAEDGHDGSGEFSFTVGAVGDTDPVTDSNTVSATVQAEPLATNTSEPVAEIPTATAPPTDQPSPTTGLPCMGGAAPLMGVLGVVWMGRRRRKLR